MLRPFETHLLLPHPSAQLSELEKKNADLTSKLLAEQIHYEKKMYELRENIHELKSSLAKKDKELNYSVAIMHSKKNGLLSS